MRVVSFFFDIMRFFLDLKSKPIQPQPQVPDQICQNWVVQFPYLGAVYMCPILRTKHRTITCMICIQQVRVLIIIQKPIITPGKHIIYLF